MTTFDKQVLFVNSSDILTTKNFENIYKTFMIILLYICIMKQYNSKEKTLKEKFKYWIYYSWHLEDRLNNLTTCISKGGELKKGREWERKVKKNM